MNSVLRLLLLLTVWPLAPQSVLAAHSHPGQVVIWGEYNVPYVRPGTVFTNIVCGNGRNIGITRDGLVETWGRDASYYPPSNLSNVVAVAVTKDNGNFTANLALRANGTVVSWGSSYAQATVPTGLSGVVAIAAGESRYLALRSNGTVASWGPVFTGDTRMPAGLANVVGIAATRSSSFALKSDGTVVAWGSFDTDRVPPGLSGLTKIAAGPDHVMAIRSNGTVVAWSGDGQLRTDVPVGLDQVVQVGCGNGIFVALRSDGSVVVWGENSGQATVPPGLTEVAEISVGSAHVFARKRDGSFVAWGNNFSYLATVPPLVTGVVSLGTGTKGIQQFVGPSGDLIDHGSISYWYAIGPGNYVNQKPAGLTNLASIATGGQYFPSHTLNLRADGTVVAWGDSPFGEGNVPAGLTGVVAVAGGGNHSVALKSDGHVVAWGDSADGKIIVPAGLDNVKAIAAGANYTLALKSNGTVVAWGGNNLWGQTTVPAGLSDVVAIAGGYLHCLALKSDGRVVAWGYNDYGQINVPAGLSNIVAIACGVSHSAALRKDGRVIIWGANSDSVVRTVPPGLRNVIAIAAAGHSTYALVLDPQLTEIRRTGSSVLLGFHSFAGQSYQVQYSSDLSPGSWQDLPDGDFVGDGQDKLVTDSNVIPAQRKRFYRLLEVN